MTTPHKHATLIKAWADGATIEIRHNGYSQWQRDISPQWHVDGDIEYRIKTRHQAVKDAFEAGAEIEYKVTSDNKWSPNPTPLWLETMDYRVKLQERTFPLTTLSTQELVNAYTHAAKSWEGGYHAVANLAIKKYILNQEKAAKA